jgi:hypothetical protein
MSKEFTFWILLKSGFWNSKSVNIRNPDFKIWGRFATLNYVKGLNYCAKVQNVKRTQAVLSSITIFKLNFTLLMVPHIVKNFHLRYIIILTLIQRSLSPQAFTPVPSVNSRFSFELLTRKVQFLHAGR